MAAKPKRAPRLVPASALEIDMRDSIDGTDDSVDGAFRQARAAYRADLVEEFAARAEAESDVPIDSLQIEMFERIAEELADALILHTGGIPQHLPAALQGEYRVEAAKAGVTMLLRMCRPVADTELDPDLIEQIQRAMAYAFVDRFDAHLLAAGGNA